MESLPKHLYIKFNENTLYSVRKSIGLDKEAMEEAVNILEKWVKMQGHFTTTDFDRRYLETTLLLSKGSIERAKSRLDRGCTFRTLMPHLFIGSHDIRHLFRTYVKGVEGAILPKMTKDNIRVTLVRIVDDFDISNLSRVFTYVAEYLRRNDYSESNCLIVDYENTDVMKVVKNLTMNLNGSHQLVTYLLDCGGIRLKSLYAISSSKVIETMVAFYKQVVTAKLRDRMHIVKDIESLKEIFDAEILPRDYGGKEKPLLELQEEMVQELISEEHLQYMNEINSARTDESRRQSAKFNEEYLGMPGSFRKLRVD